MIGNVFCTLVRLLTGVAVQGAMPAGEDNKQLIFFANHTSHLDTVLIWAALPAPIRWRTRPVAARDYWDRGAFRKFIAERIFNVAYVNREVRRGEGHPLEEALKALAQGDSLIIFPEGTRSARAELAAFKAGLFRLASARPEAELVPVWLENLNRVLPRGEFLAVPVLCFVRFGAPIRVGEGEKVREFLARAQAALVAASGARRP